MTNDLKRALRGAGAPQIGLWSALSSPIAADIVAGSGFDWLLLDTEHAPNELLTIHRQLQAMQGSTTAAVVNLIAIDTLLTIMTRITNPFPNLILVPLHLPIPILTGAALLTFARIVTAGAAMDAEIQATI